MSMTGLARRDRGLSLTTESTNVFRVRSDGLFGSLTRPRTPLRAWLLSAKEVHHALEEGKERPEDKEWEEGEHN
jgi:hypothetical protein